MTRPWETLLRGQEVPRPKRKPRFLYPPMNGETKEQALARQLKSECWFANCKALSVRQFSMNLDVQDGKPYLVMVGSKIASLDKIRPADRVALRYLARLPGAEVYRSTTGNVVVRVPITPAEYTSVPLYPEPEA